MVNQRKQYPTFFTQFKSRILTIKIEMIFFCKKLFFFARLNRFLYFRRFWPVGS